MDNTNCIVTRNSRGNNVITNTVYDDINNINHNNKNNNNNKNILLLVGISHILVIISIQKYIDHYHYTCT